MANTKTLDALERILENPRGILDLVATSLAEEAIGLIKDGFRTQTNPYGEPWAPKVFPDGRGVLSGKTSRLKSGWKVVRQDAEEVRVSPSVEYARYHQQGTGIYGPRKREIRPTKARALRIPTPDGPIFRKSVRGAPQRLMVPTEDRGLPSRWSEQLNEAATDAFAAIFGGDGRRVAGLRRRLGVKSLIGFEVG